MSKPENPARSSSVEPVVYICHNCGITYTMGGISCLVNHPPGTCCHYGDKPFLNKTTGVGPTMFFLESDKFKFKTVPEVKTHAPKES